MFVGNVGQPLHMLEAGRLLVDRLVGWKLCHVVFFQTSYSGVPGLPGKNITER